MAIHYTTIGPINMQGTINGQEVSGKIVAFGWNDAEPDKPTGFWVFGPDIKNGLVFLPVEGFTGMWRID